MVEQGVKTCRPVSRNFRRGCESSRSKCSAACTSAARMAQAQTTRPAARRPRKPGPRKRDPALCVFLQRGQEGVIYTGRGVVELIFGHRSLRTALSVRRARGTTRDGGSPPSVVTPVAPLVHVAHARETGRRLPCRGVHTWRARGERRLSVNKRAVSFWWLQRRKLIVSSTACVLRSHRRTRRGTVCDVGNRKSGLTQVVSKPTAKC